MADLTLRGQCEEAVRLVRAGDPAAAIGVCRRILETFPKHIGSYSILGQATLQLGEHEEAANLFRRVLSADPEHTLSYATLGTIYAERGLLDEAIWQMERALELSPGNREIRRELRRLYEQRNLAHAPRLKMTRAGLARAYLRGQLYPKAIGELRDLCRAEPHRYDLRTALVEALWRENYLEEASVACQGILVDLPNCLKANLILGQMWLNTEKDEEGRALLQRAQALDPENAVAQALFGARSPLPPRMPRLPFKESDMAPLDLPYLAAEGAEDSGEVIITRRAVPVAAEPAAGAATIESTVKPASAELEILAPQATESRVEETAIVENTAPAPTAPTEVGPEVVAPDIEDGAAQLARARAWRAAGELTQAVEVYRQFMARHPEMAALAQRDLEVLNWLHPGQRPVAALLLEARDRAAQRDSAA